MRRNIKTVAVLGSGIMGSRIACHFANAGVKVLLLGIAPSSTEEADIATGGRLDDQKARNRIVDNDLRSTLKATPASLYDATSVSLITTGNLVDDLHKVSECDWILEAVIEDLEVKKEVFEKVDLLRRTGSLVTSNTSGIPIHLMAEGRSEDFRRNFCGTHFFNPPRYLRLLELIPGPDTSSEVLDFLYDYSDRFLGKTVVSCKDTPAFVANRIGVFSIMSVFHIVEEMGLTVDAVDKLTGPVLGRPKSATFRTCDVVGLDTLVKVAADVHARCEKDEARDT
ncbi:MAG: 3-hydroxyacyl-CoA dehydrogenase family protein, partial [Bacteroidota bacterium]